MALIGSTERSQHKTLFVCCNVSPTLAVLV